MVVHLPNIFGGCHAVLMKVKILRGTRKCNIYIVIWSVLVTQTCHSVNHWFKEMHCKISIPMGSNKKIIYIMFFVSFPVFLCMWTFRHTHMVLWILLFSWRLANQLEKKYFLYFLCDDDLMLTTTRWSCLCNKTICLAPFFLFLFKNEMSQRAWQGP